MLCVCVCVFFQMRKPFQLFNFHFTCLALSLSFRSFFNYLAFSCPTFISNGCYNHAHISIVARLLVWMTERNLMNDIFNVKRFVIFFLFLHFNFEQSIADFHSWRIVCSSKKSMKNLMEFSISFENFSSRETMDLKGAIIIAVDVVTSLTFSL